LKNRYETLEIENQH